MASEQEIRNKIKLMEAVAQNKGATPGEREAALNRIAAYKAKLPQPNQTKVTNEELFKMAEAFRTTGSPVKRPWSYGTPSDSDWIAGANKATQDAARRRADAQRVWETRNKSRDDMGRPKVHDIFDEALRKDGRTHAQRQEDITNRHKVTKCANPESFFDQGGKARKRNEFAGRCDLCNTRLAPGEGTVFRGPDAWIVRCCEVTPGPRKKKFTP